MGDPWEIVDFRVGEIGKKLEIIVLTENGSNRITKATKPLQNSKFASKIPKNRRNQKKIGEKNRFFSILFWFLIESDYVTLG